MTRARALISLSLITSGALLGGLGLSGYYEPRAAPSQPAAAPISTPGPTAVPQLAPHGRTRFVAVADEKPGEKPAAPTAKPKAQAKAPATASAPPPRPKADARERPEPRPRRQHMAAPWPWSIFGE
jgi:hypothetical protein